VNDNPIMDDSVSSRSTPSSSSETKPHIVFVTPGKLGDGLISLVIANGLVRAGHRVTVRSDVVHDLREWLPQFETGPAVAHDEFLHLPDSCDLCVIDSQAPNLQRSGIDLRPTLARRSAFFSLAHYETPLDGLFDPSTLPENLRARLESLVPRHGLVRDKSEPNADMVAHALAFCRREMGLTDLKSEIGLVAPSSIRRAASMSSGNVSVVISPTSGKEKKNWRANRFVALAQSLEAIGCRCVFAVAPSEKALWTTNLDGRFSLADTRSISDLAGLVSRAAVVVANDSGTAHLASALGKETVCIISSRDRFYTWRPGWKPAALVSPRIPIRSVSGLWPFFVSPSQVFREVNQALKQVMGQEAI
jgi:hypothetical protein